MREEKCPLTENEIKLDDLVTFVFLGDHTLVHENILLERTSCCFPLCRTNPYPERSVCHSFVLDEKSGIVMQKDGNNFDLIKC
jgi:hypothetical protein